VKKDIHPDYHPVLFIDHAANYEFVSRSTLKTNEKKVIDGVEHYVARIEISSASHPFYTGKQKFVDTAGRIEKFQKKYAGKYGLKPTAPAAGAAGAAGATPAAPASTQASSPAGQAAPAKGK
jgi:large subunit ribosomal protein L31